MAAVPQTNLLPPGRADTPEGTVVNPGAPAGYIDAKKFGRITRSISNINKNLAGITSLLQQDLVQDQQAQVQEDKRKKQRVDNIKKDKKENFIEGAIQNTITKPVQKMAKKAKSAFGGFFKALTMIFAGWLLDKGGKALAAFQARDTKTLEIIRDNVLKAFGVAGGIFLLLNGGIPLIFSAVTSLIGTIITTIPAILALLANPAVWIAAGVLGAGIALGKFFSDPDNYESETSKNVRDSVRERGTADTLADLQKELEEAQKKRSEIDLLKNPSLQALNDYIHLGTVIAELKDQINAVEQGYEGNRDPNYRAGLPPKKSVAADFAGFLGAKTFDQPISQEQRTAFAQMAQVSRQLGENMKKQEELQEKLSNTQDAGQQTTIKAELKLLKEEALTLEQQNKGLGKGLSGPQQALVLSLGLKTFEEIEGRPFSKGDEMSSDTLFKLGGRLDQVAAHDFVVPGTRINEYGQQSDKPSSGDLSMFADDDKSLEATLAREDAALNKALEKENMPTISSPQNNSLDLVKQPFKKESKVTLVPFDYQKDASGYEGDENYREGEASGIPDLMTSNPDNAYLLHFRSVYGIGK